MSGPHKKGGHEEGGGHAPMWIVSFADMVILLMSFFVLLLCQGSQKASTDDDLYRMMLASVKVGFGYTPKPGSTDPLDIAVMQVLSQREKGGFAHSGQRWRPPAVQGLANKDRDTWLKAQSNVGKPIRFARDSAVIPKSAADNLEEIAEVVRHHFRMIVIQGHCSEEEAARDPQEGDDLAFRRALAVKNALKNYGVATSRLYIVSCSSHETLRTLKSPDRQLVIVTIGSYFLPTENDVVDEGTLLNKDEDKPSKSSSHGGH